MPFSLPYRVEYASKNTNCSYCKKVLRKGEVKLAVMQQVNFYAISRYCEIPKQFFFCLSKKG